MPRDAITQSDTPYRILMVSDFFHPNTGGVETHIYQLAQCLIARGHTVIVLTHSYGPSFQGTHHLANGLKVHYIPRVSMYQQAILPTIFGTFAPLHRILLSEQITLVHAHQAFSTMAHEAVLHARTMGYRVVFTDHSLFGFADPASILVNKLLKFMLADVHSTICVSHTSKENTVLRACIPPQRVYVIPNAVESSLFLPATPSPEGGNTTTKTIRIIAMSRLVYRKGIDLLAAVLPELCARHSGKSTTTNRIEFLIGGDGPKHTLLQETIEREGLTEQVKLVGMVPHDKVRDLLVQGDIFLNCSLTEAFCVSLVEAAAAGLLVVSTRVGGVPEVLPPDMIILADPSVHGVIEAVEQGIQAIRSRHRHRHRHSTETFSAQKQHERVTSMYSWQSVAQRTERVYREVLEMERDDSMTARLCRYVRCGKWFGKICCCVAAVDWMYWKWLELWS